MLRATKPISLALLVITSLALAGCITVKGQSSRKTKRELENSYVFKAAKRFYPEGVPERLDQTHPSIGTNEIREIQGELSDLLDLLIKDHERLFPHLSPLFNGNLIHKTPSKVKVVKLGPPIAQVAEDGKILVDVKVVQALFRGALLDYFDHLSNLDSSYRPIAFSVDFTKYKPDQQTVSEREAIKDFLNMVKDIEEMRGSTVLGDVASAWTSDDPLGSAWFRAMEFVEESTKLQYRYIGAAMFLLAHERGHVVLGHHGQIKDFLRSQTIGTLTASERNEFCELRRKQEYEADLYAVALLTMIYGEDVAYIRVPDLLGEENITGYRNFFEYSYELTGFKELGAPDDCEYPSLSDRYSVADEICRNLFLEGHREIERAIFELLY